MKVFGKVIATVSMAMIAGMAQVVAEIRIVLINIGGNYA